MKLTIFGQIMTYIDSPGEVVVTWFFYKVTDTGLVLTFVTTDITSVAESVESDYNVESDSDLSAITF